MAGFAPLNAAREQAKFLRLRRILRAWGHDLHRCAADSPDFAEKGRYYINHDDGEGISIHVDLDDALAAIGDPSTPKWQVCLMLALYSPEMRDVIRPVKGKPGQWQVVGVAQ